MPSNDVTTAGSTTTDVQASPLRRWTRLVIACAVVAAVWLVVLPTLARVRPIESHIDRMDRAKIDPSAMFYTEIEGMDEIRDKVDAWRRRENL